MGSGGQFRLPKNPPGRVNPRNGQAVSLRGQTPPIHFIHFLFQAPNVDFQQKVSLIRLLEEFNALSTELESYSKVTRVITFRPDEPDPSDVCKFNPRNDRLTGLLSMTKILPKKKRKPIQTDDRKHPADASRNSPRLIGSHMRVRLVCCCCLPSLVIFANDMHPTVTQVRQSLFTYIP